MSQRGKKKGVGGGGGLFGAAKENLVKDLEKRRRILPTGKDHSKCLNDLYYRPYAISGYNRAICMTIVHAIVPNRKTLNIPNW